MINISGNAVVIDGKSQDYGQFITKVRKGLHLFAANRVLTPELLAKILDELGMDGIELYIDEEGKTQARNLGAD